MITVHHLNNSRSQRVLWLLEELGLPPACRPPRPVRGHRRQSWPTAWLRKIHSRPAYRRALTSGGPYELMR